VSRESSKTSNTRHMLVSAGFYFINWFGWVHLSILLIFFKKGRHMLSIRHLLGRLQIACATNSSGQKGSSKVASTSSQYLLIRYVARALIRGLICHQLFFFFFLLSFLSNFQCLCPATRFFKSTPIHLFIFYLDPDFLLYFFLE
jgi:hypothetical protein